MGRKALHTQEQVFEAADRLAASGQEVTPSSLREALGGGSLTTIYKHHEAWAASRAARPAPVIIEMPDAVKQSFAQCWQAAASEAGKEIAAIREKADAEIKGVKRRLDEAVASIAQLESEQEAEASRVETLERQLTDERAADQARATEAAAREAGLSATAQQLADQLATLKEELRLAHDDAATHRSERERAAANADALRVELAQLRHDQAEKDKQAAGALDALNVRLVEATAKGAEAAAGLQRLQAELTELRERERAGIEAVATAKATAAAVAEQLKDQKARSVEVIGKLEQSKQKMEAELTEARKEARDATGKLAKALGELEALRTQVASQSDVIKGFAPKPAKG